MTESYDIVVAGHLCLDLIPGMSSVTAQDMITPGRLYMIDPIAVSTGGAVSNTGLALHRLGIDVRLMASVGDDLIGQLIQMYLQKRDPQLSKYVNIKAGYPSSSTIALSPLNSDRTFLHCTGTNDSFGATDIDFEVVKRAKLFHLGYPTLLPHLVEFDGEDLQFIFSKVKELGVATSLDMAQPDPNSRIARLNWKFIFERTLPNVDIFIPSIEEMLLTLRRSDYDRWMPNIMHKLTKSYLRELADEILGMGVVIAGFKLGEYGIYLKTANYERFQRLASVDIDVDQWANAEHWMPAFAVNVRGTTGAGDSAYAGFLTAILKKYPLAEALRWACAVGACNVESADATSGIMTWEATNLRLSADWPTRSEYLGD